MHNGADQSKILDASGKPAPGDAKPAQEGPKVAMQLVVTMFEDGNVNVSGHINNKAMAYGLLEVGKDVIRAYIDQQNAPRVAAPQPGLFRRLLGKHSHISAARR